jgi:hypothetical protein
MPAVAACLTYQSLCERSTSQNVTKITLYRKSFNFLCRGVSMDRTVTGGKAGHLPKPHDEANSGEQGLLVFLIGLLTAAGQAARRFGS